MKKLYILIAFVFVVISPALGETEDTSLTYPKESIIYKDPAGYFEVLLPFGWKVVNEYSNDPRGKVLLSSPNATIQWRIIAGGGETTSLADLKRNAQRDKSQFPNIKVSQGKVNEWDAVIIEVELAGDFNRILSFIAANEAHSFAFIGSKHFLDQEQDAIEHIISTYLPFEKNKSDQTKIQQSLAHWIILSQLMYEIGDIEGAKAYLSEAERIAPDDRQVQELAGQVRGTNVSQDSIAKEAPPSASTTQARAQDKQEGSSPEGLDNDEKAEVWTPQIMISTDRGIAFYVLSFFLLWFPVLGTFAAALTGFIGIRYFVQSKEVGGFAPLVLFFGWSQLLLRH